MTYFTLEEALLNQGEDGGHIWDGTCFIFNNVFGFRDETLPK